MGLPWSWVRTEISLVSMTMMLVEKSTKLRIDEVKGFFDTQIVKNPHAD